MDSMPKIGKNNTPLGRSLCDQRTLKMSVTDYRASSQAYEHNRNDHRSGDAVG